jgi:hypothetical protein
LIIGVDIRTHGPFKVENVASLSVEMLKFLLDEGLADKLEINKASRRGAYSKLVRSENYDLRLMIQGHLL